MLTLIVECLSRDKLEDYEMLMPEELLQKDINVARSEISFVDLPEVMRAVPQNELKEIRDLL